MPNNIQFTLKSDKEAGPVALNKLDEEICKHFNEVPDPRLWYLDWYNLIGEPLAFGVTMEKVKEAIKKGIAAEEQNLATANAENNDEDKDHCERCLQHTKRLLEVAEYLEERYTVEAWYSPKI